MSVAADPARTHAVLVGIEKYDAGEDWTLSGPARDALDFRAWLLQRGVPSAQITVLASPSGGHEALVRDADKNARPASSDSVRKALDELCEKRGDLLFLFWAGHGLVEAEHHRLFFADATVKNKRNLDLNALLLSLRSSYFPGFSRQVVIVDACANYQNFGFTFPSDKPPDGAPLGHEQFVLYAARPGQVARNLGDEKRGLFSREFLKHAAAMPIGTWPPDMRALAQNVQDTFAALRANGQAEQTPVYQWNSDWSGNRIILKTSGSPAAQQRGLKLSNEQLFDLSSRLLDCEKLMFQAGRNDVLAQMHSYIRSAIRRRDDDKSDLINIVSTTSKYPGGLEEFLRHVRFYEAEKDEWREVEEFLEKRMPEIRLPRDEITGTRQ